MKLSLFEGFGIELEYMIVDRSTLKIAPIADKLIYSVLSNYSEDVVRGEIAWSNELVNHVLELKTNGPAKHLTAMQSLFQENVREINERLEQFNAMLLPTASHPFMDPYKETVIWPHENNEIYALYDRIFDCRGHGWSNLQSTHLNLPFANDEEFGRLHAAIRFLLPIIPALSASSPILDGSVTAFHDMRLECYRKNQDRIPSICGGVIPEQVFTEADYSREIFEKIRRDVSPYDEEGILKKYFLNSRGAIARFDRNAIEIRIIDIQECPAADLAILEVIIAAIKKMSESTYRFLREWHEDRLRSIFLEVIKTGEQTVINDAEYLHIFGLKNPCSAMDLWKKIADSAQLHFGPELEHIFNHGSLSTRILKHLGREFDHDRLTAIYRELSVCLQSGVMFK